MCTALRTILNNMKRYTKKMSKVEELVKSLTHSTRRDSVTGCRMRWKPLQNEYGNCDRKSPPGDSAFPIKAEIANWTFTSNKT